MLIARQKREENIAEYILYMWQVEDILRAYQLDLKALRVNIIDRFDQPKEVKQEMEEWYDQLISMMKLEKVTQKGHVQVLKNVVNDMNNLHQRLLRTPKEAVYHNIYMQTSPFIQDFVKKFSLQEQNEIDTCLQALYGVLILRLKHKEISKETQAAIQAFSRMLSLLSKKYKLDQDGKLDID